MQGASTHPRAFVVRFKDLNNWSVRGLRELDWAWPKEYIQPLSAVLTRQVELLETQSAEIPPITIRFDGHISPRDIGTKQFKGKLFKANAGDVVFSKIDLRNGAIGIVPEHLPSVAVTNEFPVYRVNTALAHPEYVKLLVQSGTFRRYINGMVSGASGRKRVTPDQLEQSEVPLPSLAIQRAIVERWEQGRKQARELEERAGKQESAATGAFENALGNFDAQAGGPRPKCFALTVQDIERWSFDAALERLQRRERSETAHFPLVALSDVVNDLENGWSPRCLERPATAAEWGVLKLGAVSFGAYNEAENKALPHTSPLYLRLPFVRAMS